jgi:hypothetical protein
MALPHASSPSPNLSTVVDLPARPVASRGGRRRGVSRAGVAPEAGEQVDVMEEIS